MGAGRLLVPGWILAVPGVLQAGAAPSGSPASPEWRPQVEVVIPSDSLGGVAEEACWSPDGQLILVETRRGLMLVGYPEGALRGWILDRRPDEVVWSPAADAVAFLEFDRSLREGRSALRTLDLKTRTIRTLRETSGRWFGSLAWPDTSILVYRDDQMRKPVFLDPLGEPSNPPREFFCAWTDADGRLTRWDLRSLSMHDVPLAGVRWYGQALYTSGERKLIVIDCDLDRRAVRQHILDETGAVRLAMPIGFRGTDWAGGGRWLLGTVSTEDGHRVLTEDLAVADSGTGEVRVLAVTPEAMETGPRWCAANRRIVYVADGDIIVARIPALED